MNQKKLVSLSGPIFDAFDEMGIDITNDVPVFTRWAVDAARDIGNIGSLVRSIKVLDVIGCMAKLPCCATVVQLVLLGDYGCSCGDLFGRVGGSFDSKLNFNLQVETDVAFSVVDTSSGDCGCHSTGIKWSIQNKNIIFYNQPNVTKCTVQILGFKEDDMGLPMVSEAAVPAIIEYIMYRYARRSRYGKFKMDVYDVEKAQKEYFRLASDARASDAEATESERREVASMLHDPFVGWGSIVQHSPLF